MSNYTEEEQIAQLKEWWSRNGKPLLTGGILAVAIVFGWQTWQKQQYGHNIKLSNSYQQLLDAALNPEGVKPERIGELLQSLESLKADHAYTQYARLLAARAAVQEDKLDHAAEVLRKNLNKPATPVLEEISRQRLAQVLGSNSKAEEALKLLEGKAPIAYQASRDELRGDLLVRLGRTADARNAYEQARDALDDSSSLGILMMKLDDLSAKES